VTGAQSPAPIGGGEAGFRAALAGAAPGEVARTDVSLGEYPDGAPAVAPVIVATGRAPGRTLWVQACVHGPEVGGILGMQAFLRTLDPAKLAGRVILLPVTNPLGFRANQRLTPQDGENLNRAFPGVPDGSPTRQLAEKVFRLALEHADAMLDLHSGGEHAISAHYAIFTDEGSESGADSRAIARASGAPFIWNAPRASLHGAAYLAFLKAGKPAVLFESGGGASDGHRYRELCAGDRGRLPLPRPAAGPAGARRSTGRGSGAQSAREARRHLCRVDRGQRRCAGRDAARVHRRRARRCSGEVREHRPVRGGDSDPPAVYGGVCRRRGAIAGRPGSPARDLGVAQRSINRRARL
jgi:hypothetical protein